MILDAFADLLAALVVIAVGGGALFIIWAAWQCLRGICHVICIAGQLALREDPHS